MGTTEHFIIERTFNAPVKIVWQAITDKDKMKEWYFDIKDFKPELGSESQFYGGDEHVQYLHFFKITELVDGKKIAYTWKYENKPGESLVRFELFEEGNKTRLRLTHEGLESFAAINDPNFAKESFVKGWTAIIGTNLKEYLSV